MMLSATYALLWEIWLRHRDTIAAIVGLTVAGRLLELFERSGSTVDSSADSSSLVFLLRMLSFVLLFGVFNYTESSDSRGIGRFPQRLFTLPASSLRLAAVPVLAGIASVELLYLLWLDPQSTGGSTSPSFTAVLLGALMVFYQAILWTLERLGPVRLVVVGAVAVTVFGIGAWPSFPPSPPPAWRSEGALAVLIAGAAIIVFFLAARRVGSLRCGGADSAGRLEQLIASVAAAVPTRRRAFASPTAAQFWFEWRSGGLALPMLVGGVLLLIIGPLSWVMRNDAAGTFRLLLGAFAMPIIIAIPVGIAFGKPAFWSEDLSVPAFVAVRPLADDDIVATKVKVAIASVVVSWVLVLSFLCLWLSVWANRDPLSRLASQLFAFYGRSVAALSGVAVLMVIAGMFLTWRFLVSRLWTGLSGYRPLFSASAISVVSIVGVIMAFDVGWLFGWIVEDAGRMAAVVWIVSFAVTVKCSLAAYSWRRISARYVRQYLLVWVAGTTCFVILAVLLWKATRVGVALDMYRLLWLMILLALLAVPLGRVGLAPSFLARNRHR
jgi:hypothetical protein